MRKRHLVLTLLLVIMLILCTFGCSDVNKDASENKEASSSEEATTGTDIEGNVDREPEVTVKLRIATEVPDLPKERFEAAAYSNFINYLTQYGNFEIDYYPGSQLGDQISTYEQVGRGQVDITGAMSSIIAGTDYPNLYIFDLPYLFSDPGIATQVLHPQGNLIRELRQDMIDKNGLRILAATPDGYRHITNNIRQIKLPSDLNGIRLRTMNAPAHLAAWEAAGARPTPMSFSELYSALQTGVVDGQENPLPVILGNSLNEVQKYLSLTRHITSVGVLLMNEDTYQGLSSFQQKQVDRASELYFHAMIANNTMHTNLQLKEVADKKLMELYNPTINEIEQFRSAMQPAAREFIETQVQDKHFIDMLLEEIHKAEQ